MTAVVSILLPTFLTHRLPVRVYGAWVLILQLSAYVSYLNLGVQTAVAKYIAEYEAKQDFDGCGKCASVGLRILLAAGGVGCVLTGALSWSIPHLFQEMPQDLIHDARLSVVLVGVSLSAGLVSSIFSAVFLGLQRYEVPMVINVASRVLYGAAVCAVVASHHGLIFMAVITSVLNLLTSACEVIAWKALASQVRIGIRGIDTSMLRQMLVYCSILTVWSVCMLMISGLDVTIAGHFDFAKVGFYSVGNAPSNMVLLLVGALLGPLLPVASALSVTSSPKRMGEVLLRTTRYSTILLCLTGIPVSVAGFPLLRFWVGREYAQQSILFLHVLLLANVIRNLGAPYSTMVVAISRQRFGTISAVSEGVVNLGFSIFLARRYGAVGVALGTLIGSFAGLFLHFAVTMHYTRTDFEITRIKLFFGGMVRPAAMTLPTLLIVRYWWTPGEPTLYAPMWVAWTAATGFLVYYVSLETAERKTLQHFLGTHMSERLPTR